MPSSGHLELLLEAGWPTDLGVCLLHAWQRCCTSGVPTSVHHGEIDRYTHQKGEKGGCLQAAPLR